MEQIGVMTPFQARLNLLLFVVIAGLISANALYFQDQAHSSKAIYAPAPKPVRKTTPPVKKTKQIAKKVHTTQALKTKKQPLIGENSPSNIREKAPPKVTVNLVKDIQRGLEDIGYSPGVIDGAPGLETRAAILAFEYDKGLPLTATPSEKLLENILFGVSGKRRVGGVIKGKTKTSRHVVRLVQRVLHSLGYAAGKVNGIASKDTQIAIREFETDRNLEVTGRVSGRLIQELMKVADLPTGR